MEIRVFVSYSHRDRVYLSDGELVSYLKGLEKEGFRFWWDESLNTGDNWDEEIKRRIKESHLALVLVSQWFLDSDYCTNVEVESFLRRSREDGLVIFPVILSPCEWERHDWLKSRQFLPREGKTVETDYTQPGERKALYHRIRQDLRAQAEKIGPGRGKRRGALLVAGAAALALILSVVSYGLYRRFVSPSCQLMADEEKRVKDLADNIENNLGDGAPTTARKLIEEVRKICATHPGLPKWERRAEDLEKRGASVP